MGSISGNGPNGKYEHNYHGSDSLESHIAPSDVSNPEEKGTVKTQSYASRFFSYIGEGLSVGAKWGTSKIIEKIAFSTGYIDQRILVNLDFLEAYTEDQYFGQFLDEFSRFLSDKISHDFLKDGKIKSVVQYDQPFLDKLVKWFVLEMVVNVVNKLDSEGTVINPTTIIAHILKSFDDCSSELVRHQDLDKDPPTVELQQTATEASSKFLSLILPFGGYSLPLNWGINLYVWNKLKFEVFPNLFLKFARSKKPLTDLSKSNSLSELPEGDLINRLIKQTGILVEHEGRKAASSPENIHKISEKLIGILSVTDLNKKENLTTWLSGLFLNAKTTDVEIISSFWTMVEEQSEAALSYILFNLIKKFDPDNKGIHTALLNLAAFIEKEFKEQHLFIRETYERLKTNGINPLNDPAYIKLFYPMITKFEEMIGLTSIINQLPANLANELQNLLTEKISQFLAAKHDTNIPELIIGYAETIQQIEILSKMKELGSAKHTDLSLKLVHESKSAIMRLTQRLLSDDYARKALANRVVGVADQLIPELHNELVAQIDSFLSCSQPKDRAVVDSVLAFLGIETEAIVSHILYHINSRLDPKNEGISIAIRNFIEIIGKTFTDKHQQIQEMYSRLVQSESTPETSKEYIQLFTPLAALLEEICGISSLLQMLPQEHQAKLHHIIETVFSSFIAKHYQTEIAPLINYLVHVQTLSNGAEKRTNESSSKSNPIREKLANYATGQKPALAKLLAGKLVSKIPELEDQLLLIVQKKLSAEAQPSIPDSQNVDDTSKPKEISPLYSELSTWVERWLLDQLSYLQESGDPIISTLWNTVDAFVDDILSFLLIGKGSNQSGLPLKIKISDYAEVILQFIQENGNEAREHFIAIIKAGKQPEEDPDFVARFLPLCQSLSSKLMLGDENAPIPTVIRHLAINYFNTQVPLILAKQYRQCLAPIGAMEQSKTELKRLMVPNESETFPESVVQLENLFEVFADKITGSIETVAFELLEKHTGVNLKLVSLPKLKLLRDAYVKKVIKAFLMELFVNYMKKVDAQGKPINTIPLSSILKNLASLLEKHLSQNTKAIFAAASIPDENQRKTALRIAFVPLANELINLFRAKEGARENLPPVTLPFQNLLGGFWKDVEEAVLPDVLASMFLDVTTLTSKKEILQNEVKAIAGTDHIPEACRVLGHWVADFLPPFLFREREDVVKLLYASIEKAIGNTELPSAEAVVAFMNSHGEEYKKRICEELFSFFPPDGKVADLIGPITKEYVETVLLEAFKGIAERVQEKEQPDTNQGDFLLKLAIRMMTIIRFHFRTINQASTTAGIPTYEMDHQDLLAAFGKRLHKGVPSSLEAINAKKTIKECLKILTRERKRLEKLTDPIKKAACEKIIKDTRKKLVEAKEIENEARMTYFTEFSSTFLELAGIKGPDDLPFPSPLKEELWELVEKDLFPMVFRELMGSMLEPKNRNAIFISGLEMLNEALDQVPDPEEKPYVPPEDENQRQLNRVCGALILELVNIVPQSIIKTAFKIERIKVMTAESIGAVVREFLCNNWTLMKLINTGIESGLPNLHPGEWQSNERRNRFVGAGESGEIKFTHPLNADDVEKSERLVMKDYENSRVKLKKIMVKSAHKLVRQNIKSFFKWPFIKLAEIWKKCVNKVFGKHADSVREYFSWLGTKAIFRFAEVVLTAVSIPFRKTFWFFVDLYLGIRANQVMRNLELDIHENVLYKLMDSLLEALKTSEKGMEEEEINEILSDADKVEQAERERVRIYLERLGLRMEEESA